MKTAALFDSLADNAYIREAELAHNSKRPGAVVPLPFSRATLWRKVKQGTFPKPGSKNPIKSIKYKAHRAYTLKSTNKNTNI